MHFSLMNQVLFFGSDIKRWIFINHNNFVEKNHYGMHYEVKE